MELVKPDTGRAALDRGLAVLVLELTEGEGMPAEILRAIRDAAGCVHARLGGVC